MRKDQRPTGPPEYPETEEGKAAFDRFRELARRLVNVPKGAVTKDPERQERG